VSIEDATPRLPAPGSIVAATLELAQADIATFSMREEFARLSASGVNLFVVFAVGYLGGESYYPSKVCPPHPHLGSQDLLAQAVECGREDGNSVVAYVNSLFGGQDAWGANPEWAQRRPDGSMLAMGGARAMCPNSPYGDRIVAAVEEIGSTYAIDGLYFDEPSFQSWCSCTNCESAFRADTGQRIPLSANWEAPQWDAFLQWRINRVQSFIERARLALERVRPGAAFWSQQAFPMTSTEMGATGSTPISERVPPQAQGWSRSLFYGQSVELQARNQDVLSAEVWRRFADRPVWWPGLVASYLHGIAAGRPALAFVEYPGFPWALVTIPPQELEFVLVDVRGSGGDPWFPDYAPGSSDPRGWEVVGEVSRRLSDSVGTSASPEATVGVGYSAAEANRSSARGAEGGYLREFLGVAQLVREAHLPARCVALDSMTGESLAGLQLVVVAHPRALSPQALEVLADFVHSGGVLLLTGEGCAHGQGESCSGNDPLTELSRVASHAAEDSAPGSSYLRWGAEGSEQLFAVSGVMPDAEVLEGGRAVAWSQTGFGLFEQPEAANAGSPGVVLADHSPGGRVVHALCEVGRLRYAMAAPRVQELFSRLIAECRLVRPPVEVQAPLSVGVHLLRSEEGVLHVVLVNHSGLEDSGEVLRVGSVRLVLPAEHWPSRPTVAGLEGPCEVVAEPDGWAVAVESVGVWTALSIRV